MVDPTEASLNLISSSVAVSALIAPFRCLLYTFYMRLLTTPLLVLCLFAPSTAGLTTRDNEHELGGSLAMAGAAKTEKISSPVSEVQFHITDTSLGKARLIPVDVQETVIPPPGYCGAVDGGKEIAGKFRLEFEIEGKALAAYLLDLTFVEGHSWDPSLKKSNLPLRGQGKEQIVVIEYASCNSISALIFGYDLTQKEIVRYHFSDSEPWRVLLDTGLTVFPDGRVQVLEIGKPEGVFQKTFYNNAVWGTFLDRYLFNPLTRRFLKIPMVVGMRIHPDPGRPMAAEFVLYEDGYLTDMLGGEKFVSKIEVSKLLDSEAVEGVLRLREKSGRWLEADFGGGWPLYGFFFGIKDRNFSARCGQANCPKELLFIKDKLLQFWREDRSR